MPHRPRPLPAGGEDLPFEGALPLLHAGGEPRLRDGHREAHRGRGAEGAQDGHRGGEQRAGEVPTGSFLLLLRLQLFSAGKMHIFSSLLRWLCRM